MKVEFKNKFEREGAAILVELMDGPLLFYGQGRRDGMRWILRYGYAERRGKLLFLLPDGAMLARRFAHLGIPG